MPLDLATIITRINDMAQRFDPAESARRFDALTDAWENLDTQAVNLRIESARTTFLLAQSANDYRERFPMPPVPDAYTVAATDGSFILPDRHSPASFYVLNIGKVLLRYGANPFADIRSSPQFYFHEEDLIVPDDPQRTRIDGTVLGFKRAIEELRAAAEFLADEPQPAMALQDGTLIMWQLQGQSDPVKRWVLDQYLDVLNQFRERDQPIASYISAPGASELMNILRIAVCDYPDMGLAINCDDCRTKRGLATACDVLPNTADRFLLAEIAELQRGERTTVYHSRSSILNEYDKDKSGDHRIAYFYLNVGHEIGRVEIPRWVAADLDKLDLVHTVVFDQCERGRGYPVALQESHESAVLSMTDRRIVEQAVEQALGRAGIVRLHTGKDGSKRGRFV